MPSIFLPETKPSVVSSLPIAVAKDNEVFVDIIERVTVLFNCNTTVLNSAIEGCVQLKSYLASKPELRLIFNDDLVLGRVLPFKAR